MNATLDTFITTILFIALVGGVLFAVALGAHLIMLGDNGTSKQGFWGIVLGVAGVPLSAVITYAVAVVLACTADGHTFYYPIVALIVGGLLAWGISTLAYHVVKHYEV